MPIYMLTTFLDHLVMFRYYLPCSSGQIARNDCSKIEPVLFGEICTRTKESDCMQFICTEIARAIILIARNFRLRENKYDRSCNVFMQSRLHAIILHAT